MIARMLLGGLLLAGCWGKGGDEGKDKPESVDAETLKKVIQVARAIERDPSKADEVFKKAELTRPEFEALVYKVALDEAAAEKYARSLKEGK